MAGIDETKTFRPLNVAVLAVSDTRTIETDTSGALLAELLTKAGHKLAARHILKDDIALLRAQAETWLADPKVDVIITTGGTGLTGRDVTPEALRPLFEKEIDGFSALFHHLSYKTVATSTIASRACAGVARGKLIFCLPGSGGACRDGWEGILVHQLDSRHKPCNLVDLLPRLEER
jgi:molybdenum cofactor biosynthesis protein B